MMNMLQTAKKGLVSRLELEERILNITTLSIQPFLDSFYSFSCVHQAIFYT